MPEWRITRLRGQFALTFDRDGRRHRYTLNTDDPRSLADCLKEWSIALNGGKRYGARIVGREALRIRSAETYAGLLKGRTTPYEATIRRLMTLIDLAALGRDEVGE